MCTCRDFRKVKNNMYTLLRASVRAILLHATDYDWSLQGFGMLRCYLSPEIRLHVWDSRFKVPGVSVVHDHPWDFTSLIVTGEVKQYRYIEHPTNGEPFRRSTIRCGHGGGIVRAECAPEAPEGVYLLRQALEIYHVGESYSQNADEIHESLPADGTVTLVERRFKADTEHARVYYQTPEWVSAEPRKAEFGEVRSAVNVALKWMRE